MIIDVHSHYFPPEYMDITKTIDWPRPRAAGLYKLSTEERIELMDRSGVDVQVLSPGSMQPYYDDRSYAVECATLANDVFAKYCGENPDRFRAFGVLPLPHIDEALAEMERCLDQLGMVGINLGCSVAGRQIDDPVLEPIFAELDRRGTTVFFHPIGDAFVEGLGEDFGLDWLVGAPFEDTVTALRLVMSGRAERYSGAKYIIPHLGGAIPFVFARLHRRSPELAATLRTLYYDTVSNTTPALACSCATVGPDQLLYGTDYPYGREDLYFRCLDYLDEAGLDKATLARVRGGTAAELLGLDA